MKHFVHIVCSPFSTKLEKFVVGISSIVGLVLLVVHAIMNGGA